MQFQMVLQFPPCWDGIHLDVADHGSHMDYMTNGKCDAKHPYLIPTFLLSMAYNIKEGDDTTLWSLSSDAIDATKPRGWSIHADWFGAWDPEARDRWYPHCINGHLSGTGGSFCDGTAFDAGVPWHLKPDGTLVKSFTNPVHLVPIPPPSSLPRRRGNGRRRQGDRKQRRRRHRRRPEPLWHLGACLYWRPGHRRRHWRGDQ
jgi:hypothetical protein